MASLLVESIDISFFLAESIVKAVGPILQDGGKAVVARFKSVAKPDKTIRVKDAVRTASLRSMKKVVEGGRTLADMERRNTTEVDETQNYLGGWSLPLGLRYSKVFRT